MAFLLGSGLTLPYGSHRGVPSVASIIELISRRFLDEEGKAFFETEVGSSTGAQAYQSAMKLLVECEGQAALNLVISEAVLQTLHGDLRAEDVSGDALEALENNYTAWDLNPAVLAISTLYNNYPEQIEPILTSNFDPLLSLV